MLRFRRSNHAVLIGAEDFWGDLDIAGIFLAVGLVLLLLWRLVYL
jgi:hypothetical protein